MCCMNPALFLSHVLDYDKRSQVVSIGCDSYQSVVQSRLVERCMGGFLESCLVVPDCSVVSYDYRKWPENAVKSGVKMVVCVDRFRDCVAGKTFVKKLYKVPLLLVDWQEKPALPSRDVLVFDYLERVFHAKFRDPPGDYETSGQKSFQQLIRTLLAKDMNVCLDEYFRILNI